MGKTEETRLLEDSLLENFEKRTIYAFPGVSSGRWGIPMLSALAFAASASEAYSGAVFVFCTSKGKQLKFLVWENGGFWLITRQVRQGTFAWPEAAEGGDAFETIISSIRSVLSSHSRKKSEIMGMILRKKQ